jgi:hypothetical protein
VIAATIRRAWSVLADPPASTLPRGPEIDSPDPRNPEHQDRPENAPAANTGPRNAITAAVAVQHRTADRYDLWIADNASPDYHG